MTRVFPWAVDFVLAFAMLCSASVSQRSDLTAAILSVLDQHEVETISRVEQDRLSVLYGLNAFAPLWIHASGRPTESAGDACALLSDARVDGLDPGDYKAGDLERVRARLAASAGAASDVARFDVTLSVELLRYLSDLHAGRVEPTLFGHPFAPVRDQRDIAIRLQSAAAAGTIARLAEEMRPPTFQYAALRATLARYRALELQVASGGLALKSPTASRSATATVHPGEPYADANVLYQLLVAFGDLPVEAPRPAKGVYTALLADGVGRFQIRHGLQNDGVLGGQTQAALGVPLAWRIRQIELGLERLRWLPTFRNERLITLNVAQFRLWAWDVNSHGNVPALAMRTIVGRAGRRQTPLMIDEMHEVVFRPYWNIPRSILVEEILPLLARNSDYLAQQQMELVRGERDDDPVVPPTSENIAALRRGTFRLRQRPGPHNALGLIKFNFPNDENVYMHGTPAQALFRRARRDLSHGCVRVEEPVALAEWALAEQPEWNRERILGAMNGPPSVHVTLRRPIRVMLFYTTAVISPEDGTLHFAEDVYAYDRKLDQALRARVASRSGYQARTRPVSTCTKSDAG